MGKFLSHCMSEFIEFSLYKGKIEGKFYPGNHAYYVNGKRKTGVTTYIGIVDKSRQLITWATELYRDYLLSVTGPLTAEHIYEGCGIHEQKKQEAADIGTQAHDWIEKYVKGEQPEMPEQREVQIAVNAFLDWVAANKVKFISSERVVYSKKHDYIGKMDIEAKVNGKLCLIDIKTSSGIYNTFGMQTAAYLKADEEESGRKYHGRWIIRLSKETEEEHTAKCVRKNENRARKGKEAFAYPAYQVFEAKFLDEETDSTETDFKGFLAAKSLYEWNRATDTFGKN
ncbi:hypothetical protein ACVWZV_002192 [Bradyrhizobium sp. GM5.1]